MRRRMALAALTLPVLAGCAGTQASTDEGGKTMLYADPAERPKAPKLTGETLDEKKFDPPSGKIVVVNFWASWCAPCRREGPDLVKAYEKTKDSGVSFVGINLRDDRDKAVAFEKGLKVSYPSLFDPSGRLALKFDQVPPNTIPATVIIDRSDRIAAVFRQELRVGTLRDAIDDVLAEK